MVAKKRRVNFISLSKRLKHYTKETLKLINVIVIALFIISIIAIIKYKPVYEVTIGDEEVGYVSSKVEFEEIIKQDLFATQEPTVISNEFEEEPVYELKFVVHSTETNEEEILGKIESSVKTIHKLYAITLDGNITEYVDTLEEAETIVTELKNSYKEDVTSKIGITDVYTEKEEGQVSEYMLAKAESGNLAREAVETEVDKQAHTLNGVYFSTKPTSGRISSRFGSKESIRTSSHKGLDIAAPNGTPIYAAADGVVKRAENTSGGYGKLVVIDHGNGIETYYGHCSRILVKAGQTVTAGDKIAAVGSTGRSTGNHLHFEIRKNGSQINPQKYLYN